MARFRLSLYTEQRYHACARSQPSHKLHRVEGRQALPLINLDEGLRQDGPISFGQTEPLVLPPLIFTHGLGGSEFDYVEVPDA